ncbi:hypothetical protein X275_01400 [Marinitoga sp. 1197]|uniref:Panacea domain-containing protein n=1 Tax=Marinitoga sp. 1197 TaxID=1428449 RepID=UPI000657F26F|nr:Panacea domain-containing protein [Marinitoga sp. 1197]AJW76927.1 hypothetical protein UF08_38 [Marinitoga camini virus 1]KLO24071.1 hypothetical protein X275_01400 [Marinitoga sp. 1197]
MRFDYKKAVQILNWFARKNGNQINYLKAIKLLYFAERYHLRKYGRLICSPTYVGMKLGPVQSEIKDLITSSEFQVDEKESKYYTNYMQTLINKTEKIYDIKSQKDVDFDEFSETDIEALNFAWKTFSKFQPFELAEITHLYPEWNEKSYILEAEEYSRFIMNTEDFFKNITKENLEKLKKYGFEKDPFDLDKETLSISREEFMESMEWELDG